MRKWLSSLLVLILCLSLYACGSRQDTAMTPVSNPVDTTIPEEAVIITEPATEPVAEDASVDPTAETPEEPTGEATGESSEESVDETPEESIDQAPEDPSDEAPEDPSDKVPEDPSDKVPEESSDEAPEEPSDEVPEESTGEPVTEPSAKESDTEGRDYILNKNTKKFHYPGCSSVPTIKEKNKEQYHGTRDALIARGYKPCGRCKP